MSGHRSLSLWHEQVGEAGDPLVPTDVLEGDTDADVCIVGAGYTGLWTAYYLARADPGRRIAVRIVRELRAGSVFWNHSSLRGTMTS